MAVKGARVDVATSATALSQTDVLKTSAILVRNRGAAVVYLGGPDVTTSTGYQLDAGESISVEASVYAVGLFGVCAAGTVTCHVLQVGA
jgi:hypothetical protein